MQVVEESQSQPWLTISITVNLALCSENGQLNRHVGPKGQRLNGWLCCLSLNPEDTIAVSLIYNLITLQQDGVICVDVQRHNEGNINKTFQSWFHGSTQAVL